MLYSALIDNIRFPKISTMHSNNTWKHSPVYLDIKIEDYFETPVLYSTVLANCRENNVSHFIFPLLLNNSLAIKKTPYALLKDISSYSEYRLMEVEMDSNDIIKEKYYIGQGILLDSEYNSLLCFCYALRRRNEDSWEYESPILKINPSIFKDPDNKVYKWIINKLIPIWLNTRVVLPSVYNIATYNNLKPRVRIEEITNVCKAISPVPAEDINRVLSDLVIKNIDDINMNN